MINNIRIKHAIPFNGREISLGLSLNVSSDYYKNLHHFLRLYKLTGKDAPRLIRVGDEYDGGYPDLIEVCYIRKGIYPTELADDVYLPLSIDNPNVSHRPDIELGYWNDGAIL